MRRRASDEAVSYIVSFMRRELPKPSQPTPLPLAQRSSPPCGTTDAALSSAPTPAPAAGRLSDAVVAARVKAKAETAWRPAVGEVAWALAALQREAALGNEVGPLCHGYVAELCARHGRVDEYGRACEALAALGAGPSLRASLAMLDATAATTAAFADVLARHVAAGLPLAQAARALALHFAGHPALPDPAVRAELACRALGDAPPSYAHVRLLLHGGLPPPAARALSRRLLARWGAGVPRYEAVHAVLLAQTVEEARGVCAARGGTAGDSRLAKALCHTCVRLGAPEEALSVRGLPAAEVLKVCADACAGRDDAFHRAAVTAMLSLSLAGARVRAAVVHNLLRVFIRARDATHATALQELLEAGGAHATGTTQALLEELAEVTGTPRSTASFASAVGKVSRSPPTLVS